MAEFACIMGGALRDIRSMPERPEDIAHKGVRWYPVRRATGSPASQGVVNDEYVIVTPAAGPPRAVTPRQFRIALHRAGKLAAAQAALDGANAETRIAWAYAEAIRRDGPLITQLASALGLSSAGLDALFTTAGAL
jgi:hypothetical protein